MLGSMGRTVIQNPAENTAELHSLYFTISHPLTHTLSTGGFAILMIKQKLCSEQHLCILGAIMHISRKESSGDFTFFKMSFLTSLHGLSNTHLLLLYVSGLQASFVKLTEWKQLTPLTIVLIYCHTWASMGWWILITWLQRSVLSGGGAQENRDVLRSDCRYYVGALFIPFS